MQFDGRMYFVVDYFKWGELNRWYFSPRVGSATEVVAVVAGETAAVVAADNPTAAAEISAADSFSATDVAAAGIFSPAAAVLAAVAAETAVLLEGEEQFLLSIQASFPPSLVGRAFFSCPACESF